MDLNLLQYGNPCNDLLQYINGHSYLDILYKDFTDHHFPANDSNYVRQELNDIITKMTYLQSNEQVLQRYKTYDWSLPTYYKKVTFDSPEEIQTYHNNLNNIFNDVLPLIFKLKQNFQRPRPYQLAHYLKIKLFPYPNNSADSPSYPCLHSCVGRVLAGVFPNHYPDAAKWFNETGADVGYSRVYMGYNFQSSVDAGIQVAEKILLNKEFQIKYGL